jgi:hypothetical protein
MVSANVALPCEPVLWDDASLRLLRCLTKSAAS